MIDDLCCMNTGILTEINKAGICIEAVGTTLVCEAKVLVDIIVDQDRKFCLPLY